MTHHILIGLAAIITLGIVAQWLAWRLRVPSILMLLVFGFVAGPITHFLDPDHLMGDLLLPVVSLSVALILFEGGLSLRVRDLREIGRGLTNLVTIGAMVAWGLGTLAARSILGFPLPMAILLGAILVVTGPTVVLPLLRHVRPRGPVGRLVKWEGILNDPVGAVLAVLVFEVIVAGGWEAGFGVAMTGLLRTAGSGIFLGLAGALVMVLLLRFYHVPEYLQSSFTLMIVVLVYTASDTFQAESGLFSVTIMGIAMANQRMVAVQHIVEFKENIRVLLISSLFIMLAARLEPASLRLLGWDSFLFLLVLIVVVRPMTVLMSTIKVGLTWKDRVFLSWMAPRGIVAAAVSSVFAIRLEEAGYAEGKILVPLVFLVIVGTVAFYGLTAGPVARWMGIAGGVSQGCLIVGAHRWSRAIAEALHKAGMEVLLVDSNRFNMSAARLAGLPTYYGNALAEGILDQPEVEEMGRLLALTANDEVNALTSIHFSELFGRQEVYQLSTKDEAEEKSGEKTASPHLRGRYLFGKSNTFAELSRRFSRGAVIKTTTLTETFDYGAFLELYGDTAVLLFVIENGILKVVVAGEKVSPRPGQAVIALVDPVEGET